MRCQKDITRWPCSTFGLASFGICWAWTNFTWFASAYDTDDWVFRIVTMVQMIGVLVLAIGVPRMFASIEHGEHLDTSIMVLDRNFVRKVGLMRNELTS
jgi:low temperature requirement protein LtrA